MVIHTLQEAQTNRGSLARGPSKMSKSGGDYGCFAVASLRVFEVLTQDGCLNEKEEEGGKPHNYKIKRRWRRDRKESWENGVKKNYGAPRESSHQSRDPSLKRTPGLRSIEEI